VTRLVGVELTRLRWRRAVVLLLLFCIAIPALIGISRAWSTRPVSDAEIASVVESNQREIERCMKRPQRSGLPPSAGEERCEEQIVGWYIFREELTLGNERLSGAGMGVVAVLTALLLLVGTTFAGHDWNSGSMSNQLLFEARRGRVWAAKALAVALVGLVTAAVVSAAYWLAMWATMHLRDIPVADGGLTDTLLFALRGAGFATAAALGGYALTMLFRSTVATVGVLFGVAIAGGIVIATLGLGEQWQPQKNVSAIVKNGTTYYVSVPESCFANPSYREAEPNSRCDQERDLSPWHGVGYYGVALAATVGASVVSFRRRDVP
jgi:ABC-type transport system involved in multi-copper enzyme maturation permease subunit